MYQKQGEYQKNVQVKMADFMICVFLPGFPVSSVGKESTCNAGDPVSIPGEGKGYPLRYSGLENSGLYSPWGHKESDTTERLSLSIFLLLMVVSAVT